MNDSIRSDRRLTQTGGLRGFLRQRRTFFANGVTQFFELRQLLACQGLCGWQFHALRVDLFAIGQHFVMQMGAGGTPG